ncbi:WLM domain-containing protein [Microdochium trichocladiopsis]|uniref:WLM domain-containing protein n=1 Tax=Microdochium trichocladiopsis TaxID=1682393 RepID=A0A9P8YIJ7_9PEZI|nr:WLM domain-containing protein [Microdochium trichocladiopsis]KAH7040673.1 WLM domain-containing protein [Microdochium trichocladiopsis]
MADPGVHEHEASHSDAVVVVSFTYRGKQHSLHFDESATIAHLCAAIEDDLRVPVENQKLLVPKVGTLKAPFSDDMSLKQLENKKITLMGTPNDEIASLNRASAAAAARQAHLAAVRRHPPKLISRRDPARAQEDSTYTFMQLRPLPNLPHPSRSLAFLERLKADPGIKAAMRKHKFSVGLLTEMDPLSNTESNHEGTTRILGLNRNKGEVIELRLRTDAYDGYRDYKTIRNTLCHELAHNVHSPHDRNFWDLCHQIEREVAKADWKSGGRNVAGSDFYEPADVESDEIAYDHGGWTGGEFVLGGGTATGAAGPSSSGIALSRREIIAKAAEERMKKMTETRRSPDRSPDGSEASK